MRAFGPLLLLIALATPVGVDAQDQDTPRYAFAMYYECNPNLEGAVDQAVMGSIAPIYQRHVDSGDLDSWAWRAHAIGGPWRRSAVIVASDLETVLETRAAIVREVQAEAPAAVNLLNAGCPVHEDYVWWLMLESQEASATPEATPSLTAFYRCDGAPLGEVGTIVRERVGPFLEGMVREGRLTTWAWGGHVMGGVYDQVLYLAGDSHISILQARADLNSAGVGNFGQLCSREEYAWNPISGS